MSGLYMVAWYDLDEDHTKVEIFDDIDHAMECVKSKQADIACEAVQLYKRWSVVDKDTGIIVAQGYADIDADINPTYGYDLL